MNLDDIANKAAKEIRDGFIRNTWEEAAHQKTIATIIYRNIKEAGEADVARAAVEAGLREVVEADVVRDGIEKWVRDQLCRLENDDPCAGRTS